MAAAVGAAHENDQTNTIQINGLSLIAQALDHCFRAAARRQAKPGKPGANSSSVQCDVMVN
jgi:hypothetical protein